MRKLTSPGGTTCDSLGAQAPGIVAEIHSEPQSGGMNSTFRVNVPQLFIDIDREGTELGSPERGFPEWKSTLNLDWFYNTWSARLAFRYIDSMEEQCVGLVADFGLQDDFCSNGALGNKIDSSLWTDFQITWSPETKSQGQWAFTFGVDNLFDEDVPICFSCDLNSFDGTLYPIPGRYYYGKINYYLN